jgi:nucleoside-diphosphate-sugar epimerase
MACYLIGARGRLGQAIASEYAADGIVVLDRSLYEGWSAGGGDDLVSRYFEQRADDRTTIFVASGLLDPNLAHEALFRVNYALPKHVIDGSAKTGAKVVTFGTVMEGFLKSKNAYIQSKTALGDYAADMGAKTGRVTHVRLHTLFGRGDPSPFMFLGQMLAAIQADRPFPMTSGKQLREYHHLTDEAAAIRKIARFAAPGVFDLSHGKPLSLKAIAESVFAAVGKSHLLQVGALPEPQDENYDKVLQPAEFLREVEFRDSSRAIVEYMKHCYFRAEANA